MEEIYAYPRDTLNIAADGENTVMDTWDDLADAGLDSSLVAEIGDIFAGLSNNHTGVFGANECAESQDVVSGRRW